MGAVVEVERYRLEHGVTDGRSTIGPEPVDLERSVMLVTALTPVTMPGAGG